MLQLDTLGRLALRDGAEPLLARRRKELTLLAYLARRAPRSVPRAELTALLWGGKDEARARQSLRQALSTLRSVVGDAMHATADHVRLDPDGVILDVHRFEKALEAGNPGEAVLLWGGDFLAGAEDIGDDHFRAWLDGERVSLRARLAAAYQRLAEEDRSAGRSTAEVQHALAWTDALPYDETAHHSLVDALRLAGRTAEARARHTSFVARLREDLGVEASPAFVRLGESLGAAPSASRVSARALLTPDLVGRGGVLGRLTDAWHRVRRGEAAVVLLLGDEGTGKSRVCRELARVVRESGEPAVVLEGRAFEAERETPWSTFRGALSRLSDAPGLVGAPPGALAVLAGISPEIAERFPRLTASHASIPAREAVPRVLSEVAVEAPLLLVIDDATLADGASIEVLCALIRRPPASSLLLLAARPESIVHSPLGAELRQAAAHATEIELQPLKVDDVELMVGSMMPLAPETARVLAERLHLESAGNPSHVERLVSAWADLGVLSIRPDGRWIPTRPLGADLPIPVGVRESSLERLRGLSPESRRVAEAAAVWRGEVAPALLEATAGVTGDAFASSLGELLSRRLLRESPRRPRTHEFTSDTVRRAVYESVPPSRRRALHRAAARALRVLPAGPDREHLVREHAALGGRGMMVGPWVTVSVLAAAALTLAAGRAMMSRSAVVPRGGQVVLADVENATRDSSLGRTFYTAATIALQDSRHASLFPRARVRETLARMRRAGGDSAFDEPLAREVAVREGLAFVIVLGVSQVDSSFLLTARLVDPAMGDDRGARSVRVTGRGPLLEGLDRLLVMVREDLGESRRWLRDSTARLPRITTSSLEALRAFVDGRDAYSRQTFARAQEHLERAVALDPEFALAHAFLSDVHWYGRSDRVAAKAALDRALALTDRLGERELLRIRAQAVDRFGNPEDATPLFETLAQRYPDRDSWYVLGDHYLRQRRCSEALPALRRSIGFDSLFHVSHTHVARCLILEGDAGGALAAFAAAARGDTLALLRPNTNHAWGTAFVQAGDLRAADSVYRLMLARPGMLERVRAHHSLAWLAMYRGRYRDAAARLRTGIAMGGRGGFTLSDLRDRTMLAEVLRALGDRAGAAAQLDTVAALAGTVNVPPAYHVAIGMGALRLGRLAQARASLAAIRAVEIGGAQHDDLARRSLESALHLASGDAEGAKRVAAADEGRVFQTYRRAVQAQAFAALGQLDSAAVAAAKVSEIFAFGWEEQFEWLRGSLLAGEYAEARGDTATAVAAYSRFADRWKDGDQDLADLVKARRGVARLSQGTTESAKR